MGRDIVILQGGISHSVAALYFFYPCPMQRLEVVQMDGEPHGLKDVTLGYKPCGLAISPNSNYMVVGGTAKRLELYTTAGIFVSTLSTKRSWIWAVGIRPGASSGSINVACGTEDGSVAYESVSISIVHGLYKV